MKLRLSFAAAPLIAATLFTPAHAQPIVISISDCDFFQSSQSSVRSAQQTDSFDVYYIRAWRQDTPETVLTTGNFASQRDAYDYFTNYLE